MKDFHEYFRQPEVHARHVENLAHAQKQMRTTTDSRLFLAWFLLAQIIREGLEATYLKLPAGLA